MVADLPGIVAEAIEKAIAGGWDNKYNFIESRGWSANELAQWLIETDHIYYVIFNHDFAKALWPGVGKGIVIKEKGNIIDANHWQYHLQQMVIAVDPIKYLSEHLG